MKKHYFSLFSFVLVLSVLFSSIVYADVGRDPGGYYEHPEGHFHSQDELNRWHDYNFQRIASRLGCIMNGSEHEELIDYLQRERNFTEGRTPYSWLYDNVTVSYNSSDEPFVIGFSDEYLSTVRDFIDWYKADCDSKQVFTWKRVGTPSDLFKGSDFWDVDDYNYVINYLNNLCNKHDFIYTVKVGSSSEKCGYLLSVGLSVSECIVVDEHLYPSVKNFTDIFNVNLDNQPPYKIYFCVVNNRIQSEFNNWSDFSNNCNIIPGFTGGFGSNSPTYYFTYNNSSYGYSSGSIPNNVWSDKFLQFFADIDRSWGSANCFLFASSRQYIRNFKDKSSALDFLTGSIKPAYYTTQPTLSGNTITAQQLNNGVNYGDIIGGDKYIITPGPGNPVIVIPPSPDTDPNPNPNPNPSPYPTPDPGDGGWDFSDLLKGLMSLIQSIFNLISSLVGYIAQLLGDLINTVTGLVDRLKLMITGGVMELFTAFFPWLPPEVASLISLSFLLGVVIAVIKFIRG